MNKKAKLASLALGFLGLNGTGFAIVGNGLEISSLFEPGGAFSSLFSSRSISTPSSKRLDIKGDNTDSLDLELREKIKEVGLNEAKPEGLGIVEERIDLVKSTSSVTSIFKEAGREGQVIGIQGKVEEGYQQAIQDKGLLEKYSNLVSATEKVKKWEETQKELVPRAKRSTPKKEDIPALTKQERIALKEFFVTYSFLNSTKSGLYRRLQEANAGSDFLLSEISRNTQEKMSPVQEVQQALTRIKWGAGKIQIKVERKTRTGQLIPPIPSKENSYGWVSWQNNPYRHFFSNQEEFQKAMDNMDKAQITLDEYLESKRTEGIFATILGPGMVQWVYRDKEKYENAVGDTHSSIELQVGKKLIEWMGR